MDQVGVLIGETVFHGVIDGQFVVQRPAVPVLEQRHPVVETEILGLLVHRLLGRVLGQELLQVVGRGVGAAEVLEAAARGEPGADARAARQLIDEKGVGFGEFEGDGVIVDLLHLPVLAVDLELEERRGDDILVEIDVLVPEHEIVRREGLAVGPLGAFAQVDRRRLAVVADLPVAGEAGDDLGAGVIEGQDLVGGIDAVAVFMVGRSGEGPSPVAAVFSRFPSGASRRKAVKARAGVCRPRAAFPLSPVRRASGLP